MTDQRRPLDCLRFGCLKVADEHGLTYCPRCMHPPPGRTYSTPALASRQQESRDAE